MPSYSRKVAIPGKSSGELYEKISIDIEKFLEKSQIGKCDVSVDAKTKTIDATGKMFSASISCEEGHVTLEIKLSLIALPFRGKIDTGIDRWLAKAFGIRS